jgi:hypothetical protein
LLAQIEARLWLLLLKSGSPLEGLEGFGNWTIRKIVRETDPAFMHPELNDLPGLEILTDNAEIGEGRGG